MSTSRTLLVFFLIATATTATYPLPLHDALPIYEKVRIADLGDDESGAAPDRLEPADDEVDLVRRHVALAPAAVDQPLVDPLGEPGLELRVVFRSEERRVGKACRRRAQGSK